MNTGALKPVDAPVKRWGLVSSFLLSSASPLPNTNPALHPRQVEGSKAEGFFTYLTSAFGLLEKSEAIVLVVGGSPAWIPAH